MADTITTMRSALAACAARNPAGADSAAEAYYELLRAHDRQEAAPDPIGCVAAVGDAVSDAALAGAVTPSEALSALHDIIGLAAPMVPPSAPAAHHRLRRCRRWTARVMPRLMTAASPWTSSTT